MVVLERGARGSGRSQILLLRVIFAVDATFYRTNAMLVELWLVASPGISLAPLQQYALTCLPLGISLHDFDLELLATTTGGLRFHWRQISIMVGGRSS